MLQKIYGPESEERRYSPAVCLGTEVDYIAGYPDESKISASSVERQNLTMRMGMGMRRFTRRPTPSQRRSRTLPTRSASYMHYNFARPHRSLKERYPRTPAMAAGVAGHVWSLEEIAGLLD